MPEDLFYWDHAYNTALIVNLVIVIGLFTSLRLFSGTISHINASDELLKKDNPAFGLSLAGVTFAITILLSGTIYGGLEDNALDSAISVGLYGVIGIILMAITRVIFDKVALPNISLRDEITRGNMAVSIADTANVLAAAVIIQTVMIWITDNTISAILTLLAVYAVSKVILTATTYIKLISFNLVNKEYSIERELQQGNVAVALSFAGSKIMTALAIALASEIVVYELYEGPLLFLAWAAASLVFIFLLRCLAFIAEKIILFRINVNQEILEQKNIAIGAVQAVIYIAVGVLLAEF